MSEEGQFDGVLMSIVQQNRGIDGFFDNIFSFLRRKTDFFENQKMAEEMIVKHTSKHFLAYGKQKQDAEKIEAEKKKREEARKQQLLKEQQQREEQKKQAEQKVVVEEKKQEVVEQQEGQKKEEEDNGPAPVGNGGTTDKYTWTQTLDEMHMFIPVDEGLRAKQLKVNISTKHLLIQIEGQQPLINGEFPEKINTDDSLWTLETNKEGKVIHVSIQKWRDQNSWWASAIKGDPEINTQKINPEPSKVSDLEGETKTTVEKMMFDMRQKQMGLPSSDELAKQDKLKEFMKMHPEMDFSKCKFN